MSRMVNNELLLRTVDWDTDVAQSEKEVSFFRNMIVRTLFVMNGVFLCASFGILGYFVRPTEGLLVLHYNVYFGVEIQGAWWQVFLLPVAGSLFFVGHTFLARSFYYLSERIATYLMLFGTVLLNGGIVIASAGVAFINY